MKNAKIDHEGKSRQYRKHPIGRRMIAGLLCTCLSLVSLPIDHSGYLLLASQKQEIVMLSALPKEVREQTVRVGTELEELDLPDTLTAVCRPLEESELPSEAEGDVPPTEGTEAENPDENLESSALEDVAESTEENINTAQTETVTIENISWTSEPEYDCETEGSYVFTPVLPESYVLAADMELPEIVASVVRDGETEENGNPNQDKEERKLKKIKGKESVKLLEEESMEFLEEESMELLAEEKAASLAEPGCGTISEDTVWEGNAFLADGTLIVDSEATLTINGTLTISGSVIIKGGGRIVRGSRTTGFKVPSGAELTLENITLDGALLSSSYPMIDVNAGGKLAVNEGSRIERCKTTSSGGAIKNVGSVVLNGAVIEDCAASGSGGAIYNTSKGLVTIEYAVIKNCSATAGGAIYNVSGLPKVVIKDGKINNNSADLGGALYVCGADLDVYGGEFRGNTASSKGGAIYQCGCKGMMDIKGGYFTGNKCSSEAMKGSGAIFNSTKYGSDSSGSAMTLSGDIHFEGDGIQESGTDGVYLDIASNFKRKALISKTLTYPVTFFLGAQEGRVIAKGSEGYSFLHERDMKKIRFVDVSGSGVPWYAVLSEDKMEVMLSKTPPPYLDKYYIYYISNGAEGSVVDDAKNGAGYDMGEEVPVLPADSLQREGYTFKEWNTQPDGSGKGYQPGETLTIEGDTDLYAIFVKGKTLTADFYSGSEGKAERKSVEVDMSAESGKITAPQLAEMEGWTPVGWDADLAGYAGDIAPEDEIILTEDKEFYGIYEKDVVLSYQAKNADIIPEKSVGKMYANVHNEISTTMAKVTVAPAAVRYGYAFTGWNTRADGQGTMYKEGDVIETETDMTLYAVFKRPLHATFYSGGAGQKEIMVVEIPEDGVSGSMKAPELKELELPEMTKESGNTGNKEKSGLQKTQAAEGWEPVGWDLIPERYDGAIKAGEKITLTDDTSYYGVYRKGVTLTYEAKGMESFPKEEQGACHASVHEELTISPAKFTVIHEPERVGYVFVGWNTRPDGSGDNYHEGDMLEVEEDTTLYAFWKADSVPYRVEHYLQETEGSGYVLGEAGTEELFGIVGETVEAQPREYEGFTENTEYEGRRASGIVEADGSLVLKLYYDRNLYHVDFDLNGGAGNTPEPQNVRYGGLLQTVEAPERAGYNFKGWYMDKAGSNGKQWDFARTVEQNALSEDVTLYAKWADETAPVLEQASYEKGHKDLFHWILRKNRLKITVPITEEGSGVKQAEYVLIPEKAAKGEKTAQGVNICPPVYGAIGLPLGAVNTGGKISRTREGRARVTTRDSKTVAEFTISEDFKGTIVMTGGDWAGNVSAEKILTAEGGGVIVEDNAPDIRFVRNNKGQYNNAVEIGVDIKDNADGNITGGIASVSYQIDDGKEISLPEKAFNRKMVESYWFTVKVSGAGSHSLRVKTVDNAGNSSERDIAVDIRATKPKPKPESKIKPKTGTGPQSPAGTEPKTGDGSHVEIYATASMIAGFSYLLLYFREHGMKEEEKEELVTRLVGWAKGKGGIRRMAAIVLIFFVLAYYHSVGKNVDGEWGEVVRPGQV